MPEIGWPLLGPETPNPKPPSLGVVLERVPIKTHRPKTQFWPDPLLILMEIQTCNLYKLIHIHPVSNFSCLQDLRPKQQYNSTCETPSRNNQSGKTHKFHQISVLLVQHHHPPILVISFHCYLFLSFTQHHPEALHHDAVGGHGGFQFSLTHLLKQTHTVELVSVPRVGIHHTWEPRSRPGVFEGNFEVNVDPIKLSHRIHDDPCMVYLPTFGWFFWQM